MKADTVLGIYLLNSDFDFGFVYDWLCPCHRQSNYAFVRAKFSRYLKLPDRTVGSELVQQALLSMGSDTVNLVIFVSQSSIFVT